MTAPWTDAPVVVQAARTGDYATVFRLARLAARLTLEQAGALVGFSASTLSRLESGHRRVRDLDELKHLAHHYDVPLHLLGLASPPETSDGSTLATTGTGGGEQMHRRSVIAGAAAIGAACALPQPAAAAEPADTIEDVLFGRVTAAPLPAQQLTAQIAAARADYRAARYTRLAARLPRLLAQAIASRTSANLDEHAPAADRLAQAYAVTTQLLIKLHDNGLASATADRAVQTATTGTDPIVLAECLRLAATVLRRIAHRDTAQRLILNAAQQLHDTTGLPDAAHHAMYGQLLAVAAYTAAVGDDRDTAWCQIPSSSARMTALLCTNYSLRCEEW